MDAMGVEDTKQCPDCFGSGITGVLIPNSGGQVLPCGPCPTCDGLGRVPK